MTDGTLQSLILNDSRTSMQNHIRTENVINQGHYVVTEIMQMTDDFAWAAGHGNWHVPPQAEGVRARKEGGKAPPI